MIQSDPVTYIIMLLPLQYYIDTKTYKKIYNSPTHSSSTPTHGTAQICPFRTYTFKTTTPPIVSRTVRPTIPPRPRPPEVVNLEETLIYIKKKVHGKSTDDFNLIT